MNFYISFFLFFFYFLTLQIQDPVIQKNPGRGFTWCFLVSQTLGSALLHVLNTEHACHGGKSEEDGGKDWLKEKPQGMALGRAGGHTSRGAQECHTRRAPFMLTPVGINVATAW